MVPLKIRKLPYTLHSPKAVFIMLVAPITISSRFGVFGLDPDPRKDLNSRSPNLGPYATKGTL